MLNRSDAPDVLIIVRRSQLLGAVALALAFIFPIAGLPFSVYLLRHSQRLGDTNVLARCARDLSIFFLALLTLAGIAAFVNAVIFPMLSR